MFFPLKGQFYNIVFFPLKGQSHYIVRHSVFASVDPFIEARHTLEGTNVENTVNRVATTMLHMKSKAKKSAFCNVLLNFQWPYKIYYIISFSFFKLTT
jgi:hypothetical protein